jgi:photosystem II stability/assembly factor-like uncharacterized protein
VSNLYSQWVQCNGFPPNYYGVASFCISGNNIFAGELHLGVYISTNNGLNWTQTSFINQDVNALTVNGNYIFAGLDWNGIYLSTNNGGNWAFTGLFHVEIFALCVSGSNIFAGGVDNDSGVLYRSTNNGLNWTRLSLNYQCVRALASNGNNVYAGTDSGGVYLSTNNGLNWTQTSLNNQYVGSLAISGNNICAGSNVVYLSTNNGLSWTNIGLNNESIFSIAMSGNNIFVGTFGSGVYVSTNNGTNWQQHNEGLPSGWINVLGFCIINNYIMIGTHFYGVWRRPIGELTGFQQIAEQIPLYYTLSQNYPNPFNPITKIQFSIPKTSNIKLVVYDILGNEIEELVNGKQNAGIYQVEWDASNYTSGVYFYKLKSGDFTETKKMILVK